MKKSILILTLVLAFSFAFSVSSLAYDNTVTLSEDYSTLCLNGKSYSKANTEAVDLEVYADGQAYSSGFGSEDKYSISYVENIKIELTDSQKSELIKAYVRTMGEMQLFAIAELYYEDGTTIWYSYIRDDVKDDYNKLKNGDTDEYIINFDTYSEESEILKKVSKKNLLTGNTVKVSYFECEEFDVVVSSDKYGYTVSKGCIYIDVDDKLYYYFDFEEIGITSVYDLYELNNITVIEAHKITDAETIAIIEEGLQEYYDGEYGYLYNEEFTEPVAKIFFTLVFAIFPLAISVISLIIAIKAKKGLYKKLLFTTGCISLAVIVTFIYIAFTLFNK